MDILSKACKQQDQDDYFSKYVKPVLASGLRDKAARIREKSAQCLADLAKHNGVDWADRHAYPMLLSLKEKSAAYGSETEFTTLHSYLHRMNFLYAVRQFIPVLSGGAGSASDTSKQETMLQNFLGFVLEMGKDEVPNTRLYAAQTLEAFLLINNLQRKDRVKSLLTEMSNDADDADVQYFAEQALRSVS